MVRVKEAAFGEIRQDWQILEKEGHIATPFQTFEWMNIWWKHYGPGHEKLLLLAAYADGALVGVAPLFRNFQSIKGKVRIFNVIRLIGAREVDYPGFATVPEFEEETICAFFNHLKRHYSRDIVYFCDLPEDSHLLGAAAGGYFPARLVRKDFVCPSIVFPDSLDEYWRNLGKSTRKNIKWYRNRLSRLGEVGVEEISSHTEDSVRELFSIHYKRWGMDPRLPHLARLEEFEKELIRMLADKGWLRLIFLKLDGRRIAAMFNYDYRGTRYFHKGGYDPSFKEHSPGTLLIWEAIKNAQESGLKKFDFMRGAEAYKSYFANNRVQCGKIILANNIFKARMFDLMMKI